MTHDDSIFDRLVDGHLSADERRTLLESLDEWPAGWRRLALAFVEAQTWGDELKRLAHGPITDLLPKQHTPAAEQSVVATAIGSREWAWPSAMRWLAVAAGLMIAFTLGTSQRDAALPVAKNDATRDEPGRIVTLTQPPAQEPGANRSNDALTLWVRDDQGRAHQVRVPLVDAGTLDRELGGEVFTWHVERSA